MNDLTKEFVEKINKQIAEKAEGIRRVVFSDYNNETMVECITNDINDIQELLAIRTKLLSK